MNPLFWLFNQGRVSIHKLNSRKDSHFKNLVRKGEVELSRPWYINPPFLQLFVYFSVGEEGWNMFSIREELIFNLEIHQVKDSHAPNIYIMYKPCCSFFQFRKIWTKHHRYGSCSALGRNTCVWPCIWNTTLNQSNQN